MSKIDFIVYQKESIAKISKGARAVHIGYKMSVGDIGEILRTRNS